MAIPSSASTDGCAGPTFYGALYLSFSHPGRKRFCERSGVKKWNNWKGHSFLTCINKCTTKYTQIHIYIWHIWHIYIFIFCIYEVVIVVGVIIYVVIDTTTWPSRRATLDQIKISRSPNKETSIFAVLFRLQLVTKLLGKVCRQFRFTNCSRMKVRGATPMDSHLLRSLVYSLPWSLEKIFFN